MMQVQGREAVGLAYEDDELAESYLATRYECNGHLKDIHDCQLRILHRHFRGREDGATLEIACGPARVTAELSEVKHGTAIDGSAAMLRIAERRLAEANASGWKVARADAFDLPFDEAAFDTVMSFKLIRHFDAEHRRLLLGQVAKVLKPGGTLLFDVVNAPACAWLYRRWGLEQTWIDDFHFTKSEIACEMESAGFDIVALHPVYRPIVAQYAVSSRLGRLPGGTIRSLSRLLNRLPLGSPLEWVAECRRG